MKRMLGSNGLVCRVADVDNDRWGGALDTPRPARGVGLG